MLGLQIKAYIPFAIDDVRGQMSGVCGVNLRQMTAHYPPNIKG